MRHRILVVAHDVTFRSTPARWLMPAGDIVELAASEKRAREVFACRKVKLTSPSWRTAVSACRRSTCTRRAVN
jgi:hypothetical protein